MPSVSFQGFATQDVGWKVKHSHHFDVLLLLVFHVFLVDAGWILLCLLRQDLVGRPQRWQECVQAIKDCARARECVAV